MPLVWFCRKIKNQKPGIRYLIKVEYRKVNFVINICQKILPSEIHNLKKNLVECKKHRKLQEQWQTTCKRVNAMLFIKFGELLLMSGLVMTVLIFNSVYMRPQSRHFLAASKLRCSQRPNCQTNNCGQ